MENKKDWEQWESRISVDSFHQKEVFALQFPRKWNMKFKGFTKSPVDFTLSIGGMSVFLDAKVTNDRLWNIKEHITSPKKIHQLHQLLTAEDKGAKAGFLMYWKTYRLISWIPISVVKDSQLTQTKSVTPSTAGIVSQQDEIPIQFKLLIFGDGDKRLIWKEQ